MQFRIFALVGVSHPLALIETSSMSMQSPGPDQNESSVAVLEAAAVKRISSPFLDLELWKELILKFLLVEPNLTCTGATLHPTLRAKQSPQRGVDGAGRTILTTTESLSIPSQ